MPGTGVSSTSLSPGPLAEGTDRVQLLGLPLDRCTRDQALDRCGLAAASHGPPLRVVTLNPEMVVRAGRDPALFDAIRGAGLVLPDGMGIAWAARRLGVEVPERIAGADFLPDLARLAAERGLGLFLLGGRPGVAAAAGQRLVRDHPGLRLVGAWPGSPAPAEAAEICQRVEAAGAAV
ncbi:MAG TPA: WecB/TagA/CpsF family glycosyltransferase, partial [Candidatus Dormibacteraeota bacterium]